MRMLVLVLALGLSGCGSITKPIISQFRPEHPVAEPQVSAKAPRKCDRPVKPAFITEDIPLDSNIVELTDALRLERRQMREYIAKSDEAFDRCEKAE